MEANYEYVLRKCKELAPSEKILDYGCGAGAVVEAGRSRGLDILGVELFYAGNRARKVAENKGLLGKVVYALEEGGRIPFEDESFSLVVSNQVFEHVTDLDLVLSEIFRVLKLGGQLLTLFPSIEVWREGHVGVAFAHRFSKDSRLRYPYMRIMRGLGLGYNKGDKSHSAWARQKLEYLDQFTVYRPYREIMQSFSRVAAAVEGIEHDYMDFRLRRTRLAWIAGTLKFAPARAFSRFACEKLAGMVLLARKPYAS